MKAKDNESGVIIVEASIVVPLFIFLVITFLSLVDMCILQTRMTIALNNAAKEISQYSYLYMLTGLNDEQKKIYESSEGVRTSIDDTLTGLQSITNEWISVGDDARKFTDSQANFDDLQENIKSIKNDTTNSVDTTKKEAQKIYNEWMKQFSNPQEFITGVISLAGNEAAEELKTLIAELLGKAFMSKNLKAYPNDTAEAYLAREHIVPNNGSYLDGLDFSGTKLFANGQTDRVQLVCTYEVKVIQLLNIDFTFKFQKTAITRAWGTGISTK